MANSARRWQWGLAHALSGGSDEAKQDLLWRTLQAYVAMWVEQVDVNSPDSGADRGLDPAARRTDLAGMRPRVPR
jgi:hypothetical protein